jgi:aspartate kinase
MKVFKFGGASVKDAAGIRNVAEIIKKYGDEKTLVVVSAAGKTTNALEDVVAAYYNPKEDAKAAFQVVKDNHLKISKELFEDEGHPVFDQLQNLFVEVEWQLEEDRVETYNYVYDQIVSVGELLSSVILSHYLNVAGTKTEWLDVRDVLKTDDTYREGVVDWAKTGELVQSLVVPMLLRNTVVTQGFLGCTPENCTTTLGREGSDYTAAIFANLLDAESQTIWKDVPGVMSGDPRKFADAIFIDELTYLEAVEMTFYGASVIHPKTIKPIQNKNIPLFVKSFINPEGKGTKVYNAQHEIKYPPVRVVKENQALLTFHTKDFSFVAEEVVADLLDAFAAANLKINLMQNGAISLQACVDNVPEKIAKIQEQLDHEFNILIEKQLTLLTIRHYTVESIQKHLEDKNVIIEQKRPSTFQALMHS